MHEVCNYMHFSCTRKGNAMDYFDGLSFGMAGAAENRCGVNTNFPKYYGIQFFHSGDLYLRVDGQKEHRVEGSWAFFTYPGLQFDYGSPHGVKRHCWICFCGPRVERYLESGLFPVDAQRPLVEITQPDKFMSSINDLIKIAGNPDANQRLNRSVILLEDILLQIYEQGEALKKRIPPFQRQSLETLLACVRKAPWEDWDFDAEASKMHISKNHFGRLFKDFCGHAPQEFLIQTRLALAAELLTGTKDSIRSIAARTGIENEFYFSRLFKRKYHLSPREYRRELVGEVIRV